MPIPWQPELCHKYTHDNNNYCLDYAPVHVLLLRFAPLYSVLLAALALIRVSPFSQIARHLSTVRLETVACLATELLLLLLFLCVHSLVIVHPSVYYLSLSAILLTPLSFMSPLLFFLSVCLSP